MRTISIFISEKDWAKFSANVELPNERGCCLWTGSKLRGYGQINLGGRSVYAHRLAYTLWVGPIPEGMEIDHFVCFDHACCTPDHLRPVTHKQNQENRVGAQSNNRSGIRGVYKKLTSSGRVRWMARVKHEGSLRYLGSFDTVEEAEAAAVAGRLALFTHNSVDQIEAQS